MKRVPWIVVVLSLSTAVAFADARKQEWYGNWAMNHDGHRGTLQITASKVDCASSARCDMVVRYRGSDGVMYRGEIERIDDHLQHMVLYINLPNNRQKFDAYLFSWDNRSLAGTTYWGGRTFGFYATK